MTDPLDGLSTEEQWAAAAVARATGATAQAHDVDGRQAAVDVALAYRDGRTGALEVTSHALSGVRKRNAILAGQEYKWPNPGRCAWIIWVGPAASVPHLRRRYRRIIAACEKAGVTGPEALPWGSRTTDGDLMWLSAHDVTLRGMRLHGKVPGPVLVLPQSFGGFVDEQLVSLASAVEELLEVDVVARHVAKLSAHEADEHHLFILVGQGGLPESVYIPLVSEPQALPPSVPELPAGLSHLWLSTGYGRSLLCCSASDGWSDHRVFGL
jgi:hypothetical protein